MRKKFLTSIRLKALCCMSLEDCPPKDEIIGHKLPRIHGFKQKEDVPNEKNGMFGQVGDKSGRTYVSRLPDISIHTHFPTSEKHYFPYHLLDDSGARARSLYLLSAFLSWPDRSNLSTGCTLGVSRAPSSVLACVYLEAVLMYTTLMASMLSEVLIRHVVRPGRTWP